MLRIEISRIMSLNHSTNGLSIYQKFLLYSSLHGPFPLLVPRKITVVILKSFLGLVDHLYSCVNILLLDLLIMNVHQPHLKLLVDHRPAYVLAHL